jgi:hypothetical protein
VCRVTQWRERKSGAVCQDVLDGNRVLAVGRELWYHVGHSLVETKNMLAE